MDISTDAQLTDILLSYNIDPAKYGNKEYKSIKDLFTEIINGETTLIVEEKTLKRKVRVLKLLIRDEHGRYLWELYQYFHERNMTRERGMPPAEKFLLYEAVIDAIIRTLKEELNLFPDQYTFDIIKEHTDKIEKSSPSYPGLISIYETVYVVMSVTIINKNINFFDDFSHTELDKNGFPRLTTHWHWITKDKINDKEIVALLNNI